MPTVTLYQGDCLDILPTLAAGSVDAVVTDPPYGIAYSSGHGASWQNAQIYGDHSTELRDTVLSLFPNLPAAVFGSWKMPPPTGTRATLIWDKGPAFGMGDLAFPWKPSWEEIYILGNGWQGRRDEGVLRGHIVVSWESKGRSHPNEKPVSLIVELLKKLPDALTVLDPFMGSGTTGVACMKLGRNFIGIEKDAGYFAIAQRRIAEAQAQLALPLFEPSTPPTA